MHIILLRVEERHALAKEAALRSPQLPGMNSEQRDAEIRELKAGLASLITLTEKQNSSAYTEARAKELRKLERSIESMLLGLHWEQTPPCWSQDWWKDEVAWLAPWTPEQGKNII